MAASIRKPARRKYSSMRCQTLVFRSGISMSATSSKVLQAKIACRNSSALFQHFFLEPPCLWGYRFRYQFLQFFVVGNGSGLSPYSYSMEITRPCILIQYPNIPCHFTFVRPPFSTYFRPRLHPLQCSSSASSTTRYWSLCTVLPCETRISCCLWGAKLNIGYFKSGFHCK